MRPVLFVSDIHLHPGNQRIFGSFINFLKGPALECQKLYILGDLFDFWIGDDDKNNPWLAPVIEALHLLHDREIDVYFMRGNRDFLLGDDFCRHTYMRLLPDPCIVEIFDKRILLSHGDLFCTLDRSYQLWRSFVHQRWLQLGYQALPLKSRRWIADSLASMLRKPSRLGKVYDHKKTDVLSETIESYLDDNPAQMVIHGHTHRPGIHQQSSRAGEIKRIVIGDWGNDDTVVSLSPNEYRRYTFALDSA